MKRPEKNKNTAIKSTVYKTADIGANFVLNFVPGGNAVYELIKLGIEQAKRYATERQEKRIADFHTILLQPNTTGDIELSETYIDVADYHVLLNACLQDIEDEKTELYATLAKNAFLTKIPPRDLRFFCISLKEITFNDLEEMRVAYIASNFNIVPPVGAGRFEKLLSPEQSPSELAYGRKLMELRGFVEDGKINQYGERFVQTCYPTEKLLPESIQMFEWKNAGSPILMLSYELDDPDVLRLHMHLSELLRTSGFKTTALYAPTRKMTPQTLVKSSILIFKNKPERIISNIKHIDSLTHKGCTAVQMCNDYPIILEPLSGVFEIIVNISGDDPLTGAVQVVNAIYSE
ncbi:hypothetical protein BV924_05600 [Pectobacterium odoriferum]|uniref:Uncharacterized protein n=1 Tax=Pectobacterium odoriferum TaxID=78398 RepID=A0ABD6VSD9_9GAMM|nr:hypothetical protein [Pectobacterium odoriferum]POD98128.1 hypothetical protein BVY06_00035 [Pectobacterium odoriferum]POE14996.1 hypothetical protein BV924_05600 [Pectobacterium odoriferum]POE28047.1 hypothetical protein BV926_02940 [Pectobacterium odoriferum]POE33195.1 hypothetical protein BV919_02940 [Pectobacterium odoriferum]POE41845.1 hypothetical protein BV920_05755 [Pectobacterium odoriferum]